MKVIDELMACVDCVLYVANDEVPEDRPNLPLIIGSHLGVKSEQYLCLGDVELDQEFTYMPCQTCGSPLGGARSQVIMLETE